MTTVVVAGDKLREGVELAQARWEFYRDNPNEVYENSWRSHLVGLIGELAYEQFATARGWAVVPLFRDAGRDRDCDVLINGATIEVKTWGSASLWDEYGGSIADKQFNRIKGKSRFVFWSSTRNGLPSTRDEWERRAISEVRVDIRGWNYVVEFERIKPLWTVAGKHRVLNRVIDKKLIRPFTEPEPPRTFEKVTAPHESEIPWG